MYFTVHFVQTDLMLSKTANVFRCLFEHYYVHHFVYNRVSNDKQSSLITHVLLLSSFHSHSPLIPTHFKSFCINMAKKKKAQKPDTHIQITSPHPCWIVKWDILNLLPYFTSCELQSCFSSSLSISKLSSLILRQGSALITWWTSMISIYIIILSLFNFTP